MSLCDLYTEQDKLNFKDVVLQYATAILVPGTKPLWSRTPERFCVVFNVNIVLTVAALRAFRLFVITHKLLANIRNAHMHFTITLEPHAVIMSAELQCTKQDQE